MIKDTAHYDNNTDYYIVIRRRRKKKAFFGNRKTHSAVGFPTTKWG
jgi:REP element-mobilizing transposase RayT